MGVLKSIIIASMLTPSVWAADSCIDYFTTGPSLCKAEVSTPVVMKKPEEQKPQANPVDEYLQNYGKPPREFVEFYLNPTPENAVKWVSTYQSMLQRSQQLSRAWSQADVLYKQAVENGQIQGKELESPLPKVPNYGVKTTLDVSRESMQQLAVAPPVPQPLATEETSPREEAISLGINNANVAETGPIQLTYYFSAVCPYCKKMEPEISRIAQQAGSKLAFTCVDITPYSATSRPDPANVQGRLPCRWRLAGDGEVEQEGVRQTPTMVIRRGGVRPVRISGYIPGAQLQEYLVIHGESAAPRL